ncbi:hypothetical protein PLESTB_000659400 [Pleodorina starrii]|uniref:Importin subunit alpha n=1 Tax=Pleodorina starrii TaxID=330485 RepID=A0A9W6BI90_9CHLO|nr:hypothetical protein PLESTM_001321100 [Pleodorina starrii]GLC52706.1 hypothetical protein PLESTB_000659400 [Pleodorina starrii]GLC71709.1 hypothetical protein PLESTF_001152000 [Pleodorina starrii]GLC76926.1 hypothetical protein PLESTF_001856700 [Pleodorina starrii]
MAAPNPTCPSFKKWRGVSKRNHQRLQDDTKPPVFAPKFNVYVPPDLQDLLQTRPRNFSPDDLSGAVAAIQGSDKLQWLPATRAIRKALSKESKPPIQEIVDLGALPRLVYLMTLKEVPELQLESAWAVCNVASGTSAQCSAAVEAGALPPAMQLLAAETSNLREQAAWLLGNVAGDGATLRDKCLEAGMLPPLLAAADGETEVKPLRQYIWLLLNVTRFKPRQRQTLLDVLPCVARVAASTEDDETLADGMSALAHIADDCTAEVVAAARAAVERAGKLVNNPATPKGVVLSASKVLSALCAGDEAATQLVIDTGVLAGGYKRLLEEDTGAGLLREVAFAISNIAAGTQDQALAVVEAGLLAPLAAVFRRCPSADAVHREATWALSNIATKGLPSLAHAVLQAGAAAPLADYLCSHAAKAGRIDVTSTVAAAEALLAMAQAGALSSGDAPAAAPPAAATDNEGEAKGESNGEAAAAAAAASPSPPANPAVAEYAEKGVYERLQSTLDRGLLTGGALEHVRRLLDDFPPPPSPPSPSPSPPSP